MKTEGHAVPVCAIFVGVSLDGFIARPNGDLDWLMGEGGGDSAEYGYNDFIADIDTIVMGRKTFEKVLTFDKWYYGTKRVVVLSHQPLDLSAAQARGGVVEQIAGAPSGIVSKLAASGTNRLYVDGGITIQQFLRAGLIHRLIISRLPVLIGEGTRCSAPYRTTSVSAMSRPVPIQAAWSKVNIMSFDEPVALSR
jgi:dihydrofolate reductase